MNRFFSYAVMGVASLSLIACAPCDCNEVASATAPAINLGTTTNTSTTTRNAASFASLLSSKYENVERFSFNGKNVDEMAVIGKVAEIDKSNEDISFIKSVFTTLQGAENTHQQLDINFSMSEEPVDNGMFIFSIETEEEKELTFQMYDEEGFDMVAYNKFDITSGNNYRALNVNEFEDGAYIFKLSDEAGKELVRRVEVIKYK